MTPTPSQPETPIAAPEKAKEKLSTAGLFAGFKEKVTKTYNRIHGKVSKASDVIRGKGGPLEKAWGVLMACIEDVEEVEAAEKKTKLDSAEAMTKVAQQMDTNQLVDSMLAPTSTPAQASSAAQGATAETATAQAGTGTEAQVTAAAAQTGTVGQAVSSATAQSPAPAPATPEIADKAKGFLATIVNTFKKMDPRKAATLAVAGDKIDPKANTAKETLGVDEAKAGVSFGLQALYNLKQTYTDKAGFKAALDSFDRATASSKYGLQAFKTEHVKSVLKLGAKDALAFLKPVADKLGLPLNLGSGLAAGVWSKLGGTPDGDTESLDGIYFKLKKGGLSDADAGAIQAKFAPLFPSTSASDRKTFVQTISGLIKGKTFPTNQQITDLAFSLNNSDLLTLSNLVAA